MPLCAYSRSGVPQGALDSAGARSEKSPGLIPVHSPTYYHSPLFLDKVLEQIVSADVKRRYAIIVATDPVYFIKFKKGGLFVMKIGDTALFIYKPHPLQRPQMLKLDYIDPKDAPEA